MKIKSLAALFTLLAAVIILPGCSKDSSTFDVVPASSQLVCKADIDKIADAFDVRIDGETVVLPDYITSDGVDSRKLELVAKMARSVDSHNLVMFGNMAQQNLLATVAITDEATFAKIMDEEIGESSSNGGFKVWTANGTSVLARDGRAWIAVASPDKAVESVNKALKDASDKSVADLPAVCDELSADCPVVYAGSMPDIFGDGKSNERNIWAVAKLTNDGCAINGTARYFYSDGSAVNVDWLENINTSVLNYIPANPVLTMACAVNDKIDWSKALASIGTYSGLTAAQSAQLGIVEPYLSALDGTMMMSLGYDSASDFATAFSALSGGDVSHLRAIIMIHFKQAKLDELINMANTFAPQAGLTPEQVDPTLWRVNVEGVEIYYGAVDGYLTVATYRPEPTSGSSLAARFNGKQSASFGEVASLAGIDPNLDFGVTMMSESSGADGKFQVKLTGVDGKFFPVLIKKLSK